MRQTSEHAISAVEDFSIEQHASRKLSGWIFFWVTYFQQTLKFAKVQRSISHFFSWISLKIENLKYAYSEIFKHYWKITKVRLWDKCPQEETNNWHRIKDALEKDHLSKDETQNFPLLNTCKLTEKTLTFNFDRLMVLRRWHKFADLFVSDSFGYIFE